MATYPTDSEKPALQANTAACNNTSVKGSGRGRQREKASTGPATRVFHCWGEGSGITELAEPFPTASYLPECFPVASCRGERVGEKLQQQTLLQPFSAAAACGRERLHCGKPPKPFPTARTFFLCGESFPVEGKGSISGKAAGHDTAKNSSADAEAWLG